MNGILFEEKSLRNKNIYKSCFKVDYISGRLNDYKKERFFVSSKDKVKSLIDNFLKAENLIYLSWGFSKEEENYFSFFSPLYFHILETERLKGEKKQWKEFIERQSLIKIVVI